jgi:hypothetical protein
MWGTFLPRLIRFAFSFHGTSTPAALQKHMA